MKKIQRKYTRNSGAVNRLNEAAVRIEKSLSGAGIPVGDREVFLDWVINSAWQSFKEERMNKRMLIENEIRQLGIRFQNGTVKKEYETLFSLPVDKISNIEMLGAEKLGLSFSVDKDGHCRVQGIPEKTGDFTLTLRFDTIEGEPKSELSYPIAFNPDPRSLWRNIPTDLNIPYYKTEYDCEYIKVEADSTGLSKKDLVAASKRGRSHAQEGTARDDDFRIYHCDNSDWYIIAVADGAGSAKFSRKGSEVACTTVLDHCKNLLKSNPQFESAISDYQSDKENKEKRTELTRHVIDIVYKGALKAHEAIKRVASVNGEATLKDFATTLMFAICKRFDFGWFIASFWVGDGAICIFDSNNHTAKLLGTPDEGEFSGQTRFITMPDIFRDPEVVSKRLRMAIVPDFTALFLMSDGVSDPMFETDLNLNDYNKWEEFYRKLTEGFPKDGIGGVDLIDDNEISKDQLLGWLDFWSPGNHDDRTIAILY